MADKVGLVIISHSKKIGEGVYDLISQVISDVPIAIAAGTEDEEIGTNMELISKAIEDADHGKGVILLYDLGSAKMNAEMAIEFSERENIQLANHVPLVEGAYVAAVEANMGYSIEKIRKSLTKLELEDM
ncbi:PTS-dependent dihydroxyacetone kinase phosphotransferase subunit DhaM [Gracilibacillus caseinilyticus]|uniref:phosphoenolpyruvate--glycerone phosphotransferase n=1 Tax=Gracilibacillus caseinilyticus TaxID=2932256 RepID=A0ABY4EVV1_9BACI|nr:dihydroxyacetone kinase phosphoryl donor subunit DhaM [Gracilibacillus caseinilyticus]UOQ48409.1 PTS-dependent dihydroxyacetone kinase phosphotransferase subunit DhaM [Gracilibacillus caseinilyticus]